MRKWHFKNFTGIFQENSIKIPLKDSIEMATNPSKFEIRE